jgi:hypothetical protein
VHHRPLVVVMAYTVTAMYQAVNDHADNQGLDHRQGEIPLQTEHNF